MKPNHAKIREAFEKYNSAGTTHKEDIDFGVSFCREYSRDASFYFAGYKLGQRDKESILKKILATLKKDQPYYAGVMQSIALIEKELGK
jgi:hypothetical protein